MRVRMLDLTLKCGPLRERILGRMSSVVDSGQLILGPDVSQFESEAAVFLDVPHAIGVSSGSDALVVALLALGVGPGDEVVTTAFSFFATIECILRVGARPRLVDLEPGSFDLDLEGVEAACNEKTRAIVVVHLYGVPTNVDRLAELSARTGIAVIEDAAQAFGAKLKGRRLGSWGTLGCFSFQPTKPLGALGDAGLVVTRDPALAERCRAATIHGARAKHQHWELGGNFRMDTLQAAVLSEKLVELPNWLEARKELSMAYSEGLAGIASLRGPSARSDAQPSWALYTVRVSDGRRHDLAGFLAEQGIQTAIHYPLPLHRQPVLIERGMGLDLGSLPNAERAALEVLSLPLYPTLPLEELGFVVEQIDRFFRA